MPEWPGYEVRVRLVSMELRSPYHPQLLLLLPPGVVRVPQEGALPRMGELLPLTLKVSLQCLQNLVLFVLGQPLDTM